jgi:putative hemolysin
LNLLVIILLTFINGVFAMSEMALASSRKTRLQVWVDAGDANARAALALMDQPTQFLSTVQIGITSIGILNGILGDSAYSQSLTVYFERLGLSSDFSHIAATAVVVALITCFTLVFGELVPKRIGQLYPEQVARWCAPSMQVLARVAKPLVWFLSWSTLLLLRSLRIDSQAKRVVTQEEISASLSEGVDAGLIELQEHQMVKNVFHLDDRPLTSMMVPRNEIVWLNADSNAQEAHEKIKNQTYHSWYPVCRGDLNHVVGIVSLGQMIELASPSGALITMAQLATPASFVPETLTGLDLLEQFRRPDKLTHDYLTTAARMALVVDEYGDVQGLLTPRDLLEAITGEWALAAKPFLGAEKVESDGSLVLDGLMPIQELKIRLKIEHLLPHEDKGHYNTLGGLMFALSGRVISQGDSVLCEGFTFTVQTLDGRRIETVKVTPTKAAKVLL